MTGPLSVLCGKEAVSYEKVLDVTALKGGGLLLAAGSSGSDKKI